jgi:hypothetical protein
VDGRTLHAGDARVAEFLAPAVAHEVGALLERLAALPPKQRAEELRAAVRLTFDGEGARRRLAEYRAASGLLSVSANLLAAVLLVLVPATFHVPLLAERWYLVLPWSLLVWALVVFDFARAYRTLHPGQSRRRHVIMLSLSPLAALRARDAVARDALALFHPLAAARALLDDVKFEALARRTLAETRFPVPAPRPAAEEAWRALVAGEMERFLRHEKLDPEALLAPPPREGPECLSWCERCRSQYTMREGTCHACGGRALRAYE